MNPPLQQQQQQLGVGARLAAGEEEEAVGNLEALPVQVGQTEAEAEGAGGTRRNQEEPGGTWRRPPDLVPSAAATQQTLPAPHTSAVMSFSPMFRQDQEFVRANVPIRAGSGGPASVGAERSESKSLISLRGAERARLQPKSLVY